MKIHHTAINLLKYIIYQRSYKKIKFSDEKYHNDLKFKNIKGTVTILIFAVRVRYIWNENMYCMICRRVETP